MRTRRPRSRILAALAAATVALAGWCVTAPEAAGLSNPQYPQLSFTKTITSHPFAGAPANASDIEGLGYVGGDNSLWVADDNRDTLWEINPATGAYKSRLRGGTGGTDFLTATQVGTGLTCGQALDTGIPGDTATNECLSRTDDFESVVYDSAADVLYVTSGNCCNGGLPSGYPYHPTVWKLTRVGGHFTPTSWQALPDGEDPTAAGWRPGVGMYYGKSNYLRTYDFATNSIGSKITIPSLGSDIVGVTFPDSATAMITTATRNTAVGRTTADSDSTVAKYTVSGTTFTPVTGWTFPLKNVGVPGGTVDDDGMIDARDLAIVGDTFYVSDGYDYRSSGDHPIDVYTLSGATQPTPAFTWAPTADPYTVQFTSTGQPDPVSTSPPTTLSWDFGDGTASSVSSPAHSYVAPGTYNVKLTVTNAAGTASVTHPVTVPLAPPVIVPGSASIVEGNSGTQVVQVPVRLSAPSGVPVTVHWSTYDSLAQPTVGVDYDSASGTVTFNPGETLKTVPITVHGDTIDEPDEWIVVSFTNPTNATIGGFYGLGFGVITDDDPTPVITPGVGAVIEGNAGAVTLNVPLTLSNPSQTPITVNYQTVDTGSTGIATAGTDYAPASGTLTFAPGETAKSVPITVYGDTIKEPPALYGEWIVISFSNPSSNATLNTSFYGIGIGIIVDDD